MKQRRMLGFHVMFANNICIIYNFTIKNFKFIKLNYTHDAIGIFSFIFLLDRKLFFAVSIFCINFTGPFMLSNVYCTFQFESQKMPLEDCLYFQKRTSRVSHFHLFINEQVNFMVASTSGEHLSHLLLLRIPNYIGFYNDKRSK